MGETRKPEYRMFMVLFWGLRGSILHTYYAPQFISEEEFRNNKNPTKDVEYVCNLRKRKVIDPFSMNSGQIILSSGSAIALLSDTGIISEQDAYSAFSLIRHPRWGTEGEYKAMSKVGRSTINSLVTYRQ